MAEHTDAPSQTPPLPPPAQSAPISSSASLSPSPAPLVRSQSPSPSPSAVAAHNVLATPQSNDEQEREIVNDPGVIFLRGMFPDYDDLILMSVLQSVNGDQDRAIDVLLGMSDPDYRSDAPAPAPAAVVPQAPTFSQEELDEQFARQLLLQDQQQQTDQWIQAHGGTHPPPAVYHSSRPNARQGWSPQPAQQGQERPGEFQEQFNKFAETGKKTIGNIFSKVKAKLQEFEQGRPVSGQASGSQQQGWTSPPAAGYNSPPPQLQQQQQQPAYYEPGPRRVPETARTSPPVQGYDVSGPQASPSPPLPTTTSQLQPEPSPQPVAVPPPQSGPTLDSGKLGLLPKRPVTLLRDPAAPSASASGDAGGSTTAAATMPVYHNDYDDDDGLEYAENPFESEHAGAGAKTK